MAALKRSPWHWVLLLGFIPLLLCFRYVESVVEPVHLMTTALDYRLPLIKEFILAYLMWFPYVLTVFIFCGLRSRKEFIKLCAIVYSGMSLAYLFYLVFPSYIDIRENVIGSDIFSKLLRWLYSIDTPTNVFPSLHVYITLVAHQCVVRISRKRKEQGFIFVSFAVSVLIIISTVFIKQHSVADVFSGFLFAMLMLKLFGYGLPPLLSTVKGHEYYAVDFEE